MASDTQPGGVPPAGPPDADPPLYKFGSLDERVQSLTHSVGLIIAAFTFGILLVIFAGVFFRLTGIISNTDAPPAWINALITGLQFFGFYVVCLLYICYISDNRNLINIDLPSLRDVGWIIIGFVSLIILLLVVNWIMSFLNISPAENAAITQGQQQPVYFLYLIPIAFLLNGPAEELLFRGLVQGLFRRAYGILPGVFFSAVLFGVVHFVALIQSNPSTVELFSTLVVISVLGVVLGLIYEWSQNLVVPMVVHALFNAMQFGMQYLRTTGQLPS